MIAPKKETTYNMTNKNLAPRAKELLLKSTAVATFVGATALGLAGCGESKGINNESTATPTAAASVTPSYEASPSALASTPDIAPSASSIETATPTPKTTASETESSSEFVFPKNGITPQEVIARREKLTPAQVDALWQRVFEGDNTALSKLADIKAGEQFLMSNISGFAGEGDCDFRAQAPDTDFSMLPLYKPIRNKTSAYCGLVNWDASTITAPQKMLEADWPARILHDDDVAPDAKQAAVAVALNYGGLLGPQASSVTPMDIYTQAKWSAMEVGESQSVSKPLDQNLEDGLKNVSYKLGSIEMNGEKYPTVVITGPVINTPNTTISSTYIGVKPTEVIVSKDGKNNLEDASDGYGMPHFVINKNGTGTVVTQTGYNDGGRVPDGEKGHQDVRMWFAIDAKTLS